MLAIVNRNSQRKKYFSSAGDGLVRKLQSNKCLCFLQHSPVESRPWISFALRRNMFVARHIAQGVTDAEGFRQRAYTLVLHGLKQAALQALEFHADRIVIAIVAPPVVRHTGMPSAGVAIHKLPYPSAAFNEKMRGHLHPLQLREIGVCTVVQPVQKKSCTQAVPNSPGGKLMECSTNKSTMAPGGRVPKLGEGSRTAA